MKYKKLVRNLNSSDGYGCFIPFLQIINGLDQRKYLIERNSNQIRLLDLKNFNKEKLASI